MQPSVLNFLIDLALIAYFGSVLAPAIRRRRQVNALSDGRLDPVLSRALKRLAYSLALVVVSGAGALANMRLQGPKAISIALLGVWLLSWIVMMVSGFVSGPRAAAETRRRRG